MNYFLEVVKNYAGFNGRATRSEYWYFVLFYSIISIAISIIGAVISDKFGILSKLYFLALVIPSLAVMIRRLHDIGKSGWWWLISIIPLIGPIWLIVLLATRSDPGDNKYGPNPEGIVIS